MERLNKKERRRIYMELAEQIDKNSDNWFFICNLLKSDYGMKKESFPELMTVIYNNKGKTWVDYKQSYILDNKERIIALLFCAAMCN